MLILEKCVRLASRLLTNVPKNIARGVEHLGPIIEERLKMREQYGKDWQDKPVGSLLVSSF